MVIRIGINGFGRIGRVIFRTCLENSDFQVGAINDPALDADYICYLIKFDSTHGKLKDHITRTSKTAISVNGILIKLYREKQPSSIPWDSADIQYVIESSGMFTSFEKASGHLYSERVKRVIVTAPSLDIPMIIIGVNEHTFNQDKKIVSNASSTLYCLAPIVKILEDNFGVKEGFVTTIHAMTPSLKPLDGLCVRGKHWRDHRSIHQNIIPAVTSACKALEKILPQVEDKFSGLAFRVPIVNVSVLDITIRLSTNTTLKEIVNCVDIMSKLNMKNIVKICRDKAVSSDFIGDKHSCSLDVDSSIQLKQDFFKLVCWYENEYSYACRVIDLIHFFENKSENNQSHFNRDDGNVIIKSQINNEHLQGLSNAFITQMLSGTDKSHKSDKGDSGELKKDIFSNMGSASANEYWHKKELVVLKKLNYPVTDKATTNQRRNPFTQCCSKGDTETKLKYSKLDDSLADGEKSITMIDSISEISSLNPNDPKISTIPVYQKRLHKVSEKGADVDSTKNNNRISAEESEENRLKKLVAGDFESSIYEDDIKTYDFLDEESIIRTKTRNQDFKEQALETSHGKQEAKSPETKKPNKFGKGDVFRTHAVKTFSKEIEQLSQTMFDYLFNFNRKSSKTVKRVKNGSACETYLQAENIVTREEEIQINTNKNTDEIIKVIRDTFAGNKYQIYDVHNKKTRKNKQDNSKLYEKQNVNEKEYITKNNKRKDQVKKVSGSHDISMHNAIGLKLKTKQSKSHNHLNKKSSKSTFKTRINRNVSLNNLSSVNKHISRYSSTNDDEVNCSDTNKGVFSVTSIDFQSNFEVPKNDYKSFFENIDSRTASDILKAEKVKMEAIHSVDNLENHHHKGFRKKGDESEPESRVFKSKNFKALPQNLAFCIGKEELYDKLDSASGTDSSNSFQVNERRSEVLQVSDLTNSLEDFAKLDKICQIIEISDELSDKLFSTLKEETNQNNKKWSFKDLCEKLKLDDFCNSVFENIAR